MREFFRQRIRIRRPGLTADADIQANIAVNVSRSGSARTVARRTDRKRSADVRSDVPPSESEGGER